MLIALVVAGGHKIQSNMTDFDESVTTVEETPTKPEYKKNFCKYCGKELQPDAVFCSSCGKPQNKPSVQQPIAQVIQQPVVQPYAVRAFQQPQPTISPNITNNTTTVVIERDHSNGIGTAGFVFALLGLIFCWIPYLDVLLWFLGFVFSIIGMFKSPRGLAITGFILSLILIVVIIVFFGAVLSIFTK